MKDKELTEKQKYDISSVIVSLGKIAFFDEPGEETKQLIEANIAILEKMMEEDK